MKINGSGGRDILAGQMNMQQGTDALSKSLQKQIANVQKELQELSANQDMSMEEKMKKRQELQQKINDLNSQLRQRQIDLRRERQQTQRRSKEEMAGKKQEKAEKLGYGMSEAGMKAMVSADTAMKQAKVYGNVSAQLKGEARVLQGEIKLDKDRGLDVEKKEGKLVKLEERIQDATASQLNTLEGANQELKDAREKEQEGKAEAQAEGSKRKEMSREEREEKAEAQAEGSKRKEKTALWAKDDEKEKEKDNKADAAGFVDIRL